jgi:hypothetical protein
MLFAAGVEEQPRLAPGRPDRRRAQGAYETCQGHKRLIRRRFCGRPNPSLTKGKQHLGMHVNFSGDLFTASHY